MFKVRVLRQGCSRPSSEPLSGWAAHTGVSPAWVCPASQTLLPLSGQGLFSCSVNLGVRSPPPHPAPPAPVQTVSRVRFQIPGCLLSSITASLVSADQGGGKEGPCNQLIFTWPLLIFHSCRGVTY